MSHEVNVYARRPDAISLDDIRGRMRDRGLPVAWSPAPLTASLDSTRWIAGRFVSDGSPSTEVVAAREAVSPREREEVAGAYRADLTSSQREALLGAAARYGLRVDESSEAADRHLAHLVAIIGELGDGLIHDVTEQAFYVLDTYRRHHGALLHGAA